MPTTSAGILLYRAEPARGKEPPGLEVLIAHMGGPYWAAKGAGAWTVPKGEYDPASESALGAARREFAEELGVDAPDAEYAELGTFAYSSGKRVVIFVADGRGFAATGFAYGSFELEWPPRSGRIRSFPEVDDARWVCVAEARGLLVKGQRPVIDALTARLAAASDR